MNAFQKVLARLLRLETKSATGSRAYTLQDTELASRFGTPTYAGKNVTDQAALQVSTAWACVRILSETIGSLPMGMFERDAKGNATKVETDLSQLLAVSPNADMTSVEFREAQITNLALWGNAYAMKEMTSRVVSSLYPMPSALVTPKRADDGSIIYEYTDRGKVEKLPQDKVWHVKGFGSDGLMGLSPVAYARQSLGVSLAAEEFQARFFANGANPSYIIEIPQWLEKKQREIARENLSRMWSGLDNMHRAQILEGGMKATAATMPLEDAQFMQLRGFSIQEVCRIYRIPPHMVADLSRSTNNNIEHQGQEFVMFTLAPYLTRIEASVSRWLMTPEERRRYFLRFNVDALLRADAAGRAALYSSAVQNGWMSRNEVRALENRNTVDEEGMDDYTAQSNLMPVERIFAEPAPAPAVANPFGAADDAGEDKPEGAPDQEGEDKARGPNVSITLPAEMKHQFDSSVTPAIGKLAEAVGQSASVLHAANMRNAEEVARMRKEVAAMIDEATAVQVNALKQFGSALESLVEITQRDREIVLDKEGNPVASRLSTH